MLLAVAIVAGVSFQYIEQPCNEGVTNYFDPRSYVDGLGIDGQQKIQLEFENQRYDRVNMSTVTIYSEQLDTSLTYDGNLSIRPGRSEGERVASGLKLGTPCREFGLTVNYTVSDELNQTASGELKLRSDPGAPPSSPPAKIEVKD
jgi:hypothetical protein